MILSRRSLWTGSAWLLVMHATRSARGDGPIADVLARVAKARAGVRTIKGPFTQTRTIDLFSTDVRSVGSLVLVLPDRLRWELAPPDAVTFWVGPEGLAYRSAHGRGRMPASSTRIAAALQDLHALLGGDLSRLSERWDLTVLRDDARGVEIEARSRNAGPSSAESHGGPRTMRFALGPDLIRPIRALLIESEHDRTVIEFGDLVVNAPVDDSVMRPPP